MAPSQIRSPLLLLPLIALTSCGRGEEDIKRKVAARKAAEAVQSAGVGAPSTTKPEAPIELEEVTVEQMGCKLRIPKGSKSLVKGRQMTSYRFPLDDKGLFALGVSVRGYGAPDVDKAKAAATSDGLDRVAEAAALPDGRIEVVMAPRGATQKVQVYLPKRSVQCEGRPSDLATLREICASLQAI